MPNRLAQQTSPYLLQHKDNPVHWQAWDQQALQRARDSDRPLLVSIGYSACHWCHVMEHESFEDPATAEYMNENFVCIKVDREERPDVDAIYMTAVQAMTGRGGWPLNVFCDPDGVPFYGGTYYPPQPRQGMPSFLQVLEGVVEAWSEKRDEIRESAARTVEGLSASTRLAPAEQQISPVSGDEAESNLAGTFDANFGGFGGAPKFPPTCALEFLMMRIATGAGDRERQLRMVNGTLEQMARGGIYDQVGGGFARYSVDGQWLVPHFEKMLYDNALLARAYLHAWQLTGNEYFKRITTETLDWALREMRGPEGGFYSALDADSEGEEGKFYVWEERELRDLLGDDGEALLQHWGVDRGPNFEGRSILHAAGSQVDQELLERARKLLYEARSKRVWPGLDDKRLTSWNALMINALADAGAVLGRDDYLDAARACANFLLTEMQDSNGRLRRTWNADRAALNGYLEDYAFTVEALLTLYQADFDPRWFSEARKLADTMIERFADPEAGGFFTTSDDHETLVTRPKDIEDHPIPSGNSSAALGLARLAALTGESGYRQQAAGVLELLHVVAGRHPQAFGHLLQAIELHLAHKQELALVGDSLDELVAVARAAYRPTLVTAAGPRDDGVVPLLRGRTTVDEAPTAYVCESFSCKLPVTEPSALTKLLDART